MVSELLKTRALKLASVLWKRIRVISAFSQTPPTVAVALCNAFSHHNILELKQLNARFVFTTDACWF